MASLIPMLLQMAPAILGNLPDVIKKIGHVIGRTVEGVDEALNPEKIKKEEESRKQAEQIQNSMVRTVNGPSIDVSRMDTQRNQERQFDQSRYGISDREFDRMSRPRYTRSTKNRVRLVKRR